MHVQQYSMIFVGPACSQQETVAHLVSVPLSVGQFTAIFRFS